MVSRHDPARYQVQWRLATADDLNAEDDEREIARMQAAWEEAPDPTPSLPTAVEQVESMAAAGSVRLCRQTGPISEAEAQIIVDFANELRARGASS